MTKTTKLTWAQKQALDAVKVLGSLRGQGWGRGYSIVTLRALASRGLLEPESDSKWEDRFRLTEAGREALTSGTVDLRGKDRREARGKAEAAGSDVRHIVRHARNWTWDNDPACELVKRVATRAFHEAATVLELGGRGAKRVDGFKRGHQRPVHPCGVCGRKTRETNAVSVGSDLCPQCVAGGAGRDPVAA